jgi:transposase-like protein
MNQREFYEAQVIALKAFGNWRAKFKAEPEPPLRKLLYRRGSISHTLSHTLSHVTYSSSVLPTVPLVLPPRPGHRRRFGEADRRHIPAEMAEPGASVSEVARRYGIARRVLCRWRQEQAAAGMVFVDVEIIEAPRARWTRARRPRSNRRGVYRSGLLPWVTNCPGRNSREVRFRRRLTPGLFVRSVPEAGDNGGQQGGRALMVRLQSRVLKRGHFDIRHRAGSP